MSLLGWIVVIALAVAVYYFVILRPGRLSFWKIAANNPDEAYDWFLGEDCWMLVEPSSEEARLLKQDKDYTGPFQIWVPKLGNRRVEVFGRYPEFEESQGRFMRQCGR